MKGQFAALHRYTPLLTCHDPRERVVRSVAWCRSRITDDPEARINRSTFDVAGRLIAHWDPRLWAEQAPANLTQIYSLSGQSLCSDSVDAGWRVSLPGEGGELLQTWDSRGAEKRMEYDPLQRPIAVFEDEQCVERLCFGGPDVSSHNQCSELIRHDDPAGARLNIEFGLTGAVLEQTQHFLTALGSPDWPEAEAERNTLLEPGGGATTHWAYNSLGDVIRLTDVLGNTQALAQTIAGQLKSSAVQLRGQPEQVVVSDIRYDAQGRVESETAGNGVVCSASYRPEDGRLSQLRALRGGSELLQDLNYDYDPVGNVIHIKDRAQPTRHFSNQRIEPASTYQYDTLYQLIEATGREAATVNHGPISPNFLSPADPTQLTNYTQTYSYDAGGNLQKLTHVGTQSHSRTLITARASNRSLPVVDDRPPSEDDIAAAFDANGNLTALQAGQIITWDRRNQLQQVRPVIRESSVDDSERYIYDAGGQRLRKLRSTQAKTVTHTAEVRYLPGLEIRTDTAINETLHVITLQAGRSGVRVLHWQDGKAHGLENDQIRYMLNDHLGSSTLELDSTAQIISQEGYYPFGGTSWWAGRNAIEAGYKTVRYSGKERDATGLYYFDLRYYAPWLQRWINPDPVGVVGGVNVYCFVGNKPVSHVDYQGLAPFDVLRESEVKMREQGHEIRARGLSEFSWREATKMIDILALSEQMLKASIDELSRPVLDSNVKNSLSATFGYFGETADSGLIKNLFLTYKSFKCLWRASVRLNAGG
jgi:insecticidal toxin complex protein TccC